ncbi:MULTISPECIES: SURF1 family protein [Halomonadaceae]|uniref:SURF1 family protein n=1 Tax=Halomonadaceae TaxID=28256 RepID=UPI00159A3A13|nr:MULTISPECIES: SURF1 family protein [Halomonas]QJQ96721.1 SURF1 family protein [Halomonas sp. PA5]
MKHSISEQGNRCSGKWPRNIKRQVAWWILWLFLVILGAMLGIWQWERAVDKRDYLSRLEAAPELQAPHATPPEGARIHVSGVYLPEQTRFLDNRVLNGQVGVAVLTPLLSGDGRLWLIQRGFMQTGPVRTTPMVTTPEGEVELVGQWQAATPTTMLFGPNEEGVRLQQLALAPWQSLGEFAHDGWLHLDEGAGLLAPWWKPNVMPPSRHIGYAIQWWGLALAALAIMLIGGRRLNLDARHADACSSSTLPESRP